MPSSPQNNEAKTSPRCIWLFKQKRRENAATCIHGGTSVSLATVAPRAAPAIRGPTTVGRPTVDAPVPTSSAFTESGTELHPHPSQCGELHPVSSIGYALPQPCIAMPPYTVSHNMLCLCDSNSDRFKHKRCFLAIMTSPLA